MITLVDALIALGYESIEDFIVAKTDNGIELSEWYHSDPKPTKTQLAAVTQEQIDNARLMKLRTKAKEALADQAHEQNALVRAVVLELLDYCNEQRKRHNQLLQWIGSQTTLLNRGQLAALQLAEATPQQAKQAIVSRIENGEAD